MKKLVMLLLLSTLIFAKSYKEFAQENGYETDYKVALTKAKGEKKDLMILLITNYCPWCKKFEQRTLSDVAINAKVHNKFIPLIMNREERNFPLQYDSTLVPVVYFVNYKNEKIYEKSIAFKNKDEFSDYLK
jgi:thioredoxin-related protein